MLEQVQKIKYTCKLCRTPQEVLFDGCPKCGNSHFTDAEGRTYETRYTPQAEERKKQYVKEKAERIAFVKRVAEQTFINSHNSDLVGIVAKAEYLYDILKTWESKQ